MGDDIASLRGILKRWRSGMSQRGTGWVLFAGIVLIWGGVMKIFDAIWAFRYHGVLPLNLEAAVFGHSLKTYGWIDLAVAAILLVSGFFVMVGSEAARWVGIVAGVIAGVERDLVDAVLPGVVDCLHRHRSTCCLLLGGIWRRPGRGRGMSLAPRELEQPDRDDMRIARTCPMCGDHDVPHLIVRLGTPDSSGLSWRCRTCSREWSDSPNGMSATGGSTHIGFRGPIVTLGMRSSLANSAVLDDLGTKETW